MQYCSFRGNSFCGGCAGFCGRFRLALTRGYARTWLFPKGTCSLHKKLSEEGCDEQSLEPVNSQLKEAGRKWLAVADHDNDRASDSKSDSHISHIRANATNGYYC
ncbi:hypothetical protein DPMN_168909 [Dreissena polymorpha]|uniref:Uncharacterized protein n=1 Tax=Dreissena polymorpha TaxID=45954 RepID=A0A9D4J033_DREPO|nr:hypothetical protein DPMN_168909 [Dreissena polymorpha]